VVVWKLQFSARAGTAGCQTALFWVAMEDQGHNFRPIMVNGFRPLALSKKLTIQALGSVKLVQRMLYATRHRLCEKPWLRIARWGDPGRDLLIDTSSVEEAYARLLAGEEPPLMPSEARGRRSSDAKLPPRISNPNSR
jgi:hypothetical protein